MRAIVAGHLSSQRPQVLSSHAIGRAIRSAKASQAKVIDDRWNDLSSELWIANKKLEQVQPKGSIIREIHRSRCAQHLVAPFTIHSERSQLPPTQRFEYGQTWRSYMHFMGSLFRQH
jgi:hypothetical protein